jgi:uncharacterized protein (TIGR03435 family)
MTRQNQRFHHVMTQAFAPFRDVPDEQIDMACRRVLNDLHDDAGRVAVFEETDRTSPPALAWRWMRPVAALATAAVVFAVLQLRVVHESVSRPALARVEVADGGAYRNSGEPARNGDSIAAGSPVRTNGGTGAVLALTDGSRVEMRSQSELSLERADDGVRIRLNRGGIIVNAAKQRDGHLYVQTKDVTVSVVGTVFLVNAEDAGSRVAVIEGEVRVTQGAAQKKLLAGEQVATSPAMAAPPVGDAIAWSRNAVALVALLQQSTLVPPPMQEPATTERRERFEVVSIRLRGETTAGARSGGPADAAGGPGRVPACAGGMDLDPRRVNFRGYSLYQLITMAYGGDCYRWELMSDPAPLEGGPPWIRSALWDIQALIPEGALPYTERFVDIGGGKTAPSHIPGPRLQMMVRALLADRFRLVLGRETREGPMFSLTVAAGGPRLTPWKDGDPVTEREMIDLLARNQTLLSEQELSALGVTAAQFAERWAKRTIEFRGPGLMGVKASIADLVVQLERATLWPVVDRTAIKGEFNYRLPRSENPFGPIQPRLMGGASAPGTPAFDALTAGLERVLGLRLEPGRGPRDVLVIKAVERPSEN